MTISKMGIANIADYFSPRWNKKDVDGFIFDINLYQSQQAVGIQTQLILNQHIPKNE